MIARKPKILVITPVKHLRDVENILTQFAEVVYVPDPTIGELVSHKEWADCDAIFTNPNKSKVYLGSELLAHFSQIKVICTASTGTIHIDKDYLLKRGIKLLALTNERDVINQITSTAEHAFALTLASLRNIYNSVESVTRGKWDYSPYVGRQVKDLVFGVIGYGRLGKLYSQYALGFGSTVLVNDPYQTDFASGVHSVSLRELIKKSDIISLHVHVTPETKEMVNDEFLSDAKKNLLLVNTSRGEVIEENDLVSFLNNNPAAKYATDVITDETSSKTKSPVMQLFLKSPGQPVMITPHVGGMTYEGQNIAFSHAARMLQNFFGVNI